MRHIIGWICLIIILKIELSRCDRCLPVPISNSQVSSVMGPPLPPKTTSLFWVWKYPNAMSLRADGVVAPAVTEDHSIGSTGWAIAQITTTTTDHNIALSLSPNEEVIAGCLDLDTGQLNLLVLCSFFTFLPSSRRCKH